MVYKIGGAAQRQVNIQIFSVFQTQMEHTFLCLERNLDRSTFGDGYTFSEPGAQNHVRHTHYV